VDDISGMAAGMVGWCGWQATVENICIHIIYNYFISVCLSLVLLHLVLLHLVLLRLRLVC
jgi:hypothetical protein